MRPVARNVLGLFLVFALARMVSAAPADNKQLEQDVDKIKTWGATYGDARLLEEDPAKLAEVVAQAP